MKRTIYIGLFIALFLPTVVSAAWWNPLSWFNYWGSNKGSDVKTEVLEKRIQELEKKIATSTPVEPEVKLKPAVSTPKKTVVEPKKEPVQTPQVVTSTVTKPAVDKYGMTEEDWQREIKGMSLSYPRIAENEKIISDLNGYISSVDQSMNSVSQQISSPGFLDATARSFADVYMKAAQDLRAGYIKESALVKNENNIMNQINNAIKSRNLDLMKQLGVAFTENNKQILQTTTDNSALFIKYRNAFDTYRNYITKLRSQ